MPGRPVPTGPRRIASRSTGRRLGTSGMRAAQYAQAVAADQRRSDRPRIDPGTCILHSGRLPRGAGAVAGRGTSACSVPPDSGPWPVTRTSGISAATPRASARDGAPWSTTRSAAEDADARPIDPRTWTRPSIRTSVGWSTADSRRVPCRGWPIRSGRVPAGARGRHARRRDRFRGRRWPRHSR